MVGTSSLALCSWQRAPGQRVGMRANLGGSTRCGQVLGEPMGKHGGIDARAPPVPLPLPDHAVTDRRRDNRVFRRRGQVQRPAHQRGFHDCTGPQTILEIGDRERLQPGGQRQVRRWRVLRLHRDQPAQRADRPDRNPLQKQLTGQVCPVQLARRQHADPRHTSPRTQLVTSPRTPPMFGCGISASTGRL